MVLETRESIKDMAPQGGSPNDPLVEMDTALYALGRMAMRLCRLDEGCGPELRRAIRFAEEYSAPAEGVPYEVATIMAESLAHLGQRGIDISRAMTTARYFGAEMPAQPQFADVLGG